MAAFEGMKALWEVTRRNAGADVDVFFECALRACPRGSSQTSTTPVAAAATA